MGKILAAAPATILVWLDLEDKNLNIVTEEINKAIKCPARAITRIKLADKVRSELVLSKAGLRGLNEATSSAMAILLWKSKHTMNPLGTRLFARQDHKRNTRFAESENISPPVPGFHMLPANLLAKIWNTVPGLQTATTLGAAKTIARKWSKSLPR